MPTWLGTRWPFLKAAEEICAINRNVQEVFPGRKTLGDQNLLFSYLSKEKKKKKGSFGVFLLLDL